jgi:hypothetical protein
MPGDVTVGQPRAWIIFLEGEGKVSVTRKGRNITAGWLSQAKA